MDLKRSWELDGSRTLDAHGQYCSYLWKRPADRVRRNARRFEVPKYQASIDIGSDRGNTADLAWELYA
jgi:hypothetical protein